MRTLPTGTTDLEDGKRGPEAKECGQPLDAEKYKGSDSLLESQKGTEAYRHLDFSLVRPNSDFWLNKTLR